MCLQKVWKLTYRLKGIVKRVFRWSKKELEMMPKEWKKMVTECKTRIGKQAFSMEGIATTKVSSRNTASKFVDIGVDFVKKRSMNQRIIKQSKGRDSEPMVSFSVAPFYRF